MLRRILRIPVLSLASCLTTGCITFDDSQVQGLDLAALEDDEAYVVGTITTVERFDDGTAVVLIDSPEIRYSVDVRPLHGEQSLLDSIATQLIEDAIAPRVDVDGEESPALFAVKVSAGRHQLASISINNGNVTWIATINGAFDAAPATVTYVGDLRLRIDSEAGLFGIHLWKSVVASVRDDRALFDELMRTRFPGEHPDVRVSLATLAEPEQWTGFRQESNGP